MNNNKSISVLVMKFHTWIYHPLHRDSEHVRRPQSKERNIRNGEKDIRMVEILAPD
jgi:hypothetical protein